MGDLSSDVERCLCDCACDAERVQRAKCSCEEGRAREAKRVLLSERQRLLDEMHSRQRGIDAIDHMLHRVSCECTSRRVCADGTQEKDAEAACAEEDTGCSGEGEVSARG